MLAKHSGQPRESDIKDRDRDYFMSPAQAKEYGLVDEVIEPAETRQRLIGALSLLDGKRDTNPPKKHGNIPL